ncbi:hypothetical protein FQZ97_936140 [compost metagenome]
MCADIHSFFFQFKGFTEAFFVGNPHAQPGRHTKVLLNGKEYGIKQLKIKYRNRGGGDHIYGEQFRRVASLQLMNVCLAHLYTGGGFILGNADQLSIFRHPDLAIGKAFPRWFLKGCGLFLERPGILMVFFRKRAVHQVE